jgi:hypothetical protein
MPHFAVTLRWTMDHFLPVVIRADDEYTARQQAQDLLDTFAANPAELAPHVRGEWEMQGATTEIEGIKRL